MLNCTFLDLANYYRRPPRYCIGCSPTTTTIFRCSNNIGGSSCEALSGWPAGMGSSVQTETFRGASHLQSDVDTPISGLPCVLIGFLLFRHAQICTDSAHEDGDTRFADLWCANTRMHFLVQEKAIQHAETFRCAGRESGQGAPKRAYRTPSIPMKQRLLEADADSCYSFVCEHCSTALQAD